MGRLLVERSRNPGTVRDAEGFQQGIEGLVGRVHGSGLNLGHMGVSTLLKEVMQLCYHHQVKIESSQPKIVENKQGLLISFKIEGSEVDSKPATPSLLTDFGDIATNRSGVARWIMTTSLYGRFVDFNATFTHSDELGGQLTSLITEINTHRLIRDVLVDLTGRDNIR
ncbi:hypothetical protein EON64_18415, partial [archaeon]